jgi:hypothetical protein
MFQVPMIAVLLPPEMLGQRKEGGLANAHEESIMHTAPLGHVWHLAPPPDIAL